MDATITFYPSAPERAKTLADGDVERFNERGFVRPLDALTGAEVDAAREYFESLLARVRALKDGRNAYTLDGYHNRCRGIWEMARHPVILDYVEDLLGPDFVCWSSHYFCKLPGDPKRVPWHQDATYWPVRPTKTITVWLAIDDVDEGNAPMAVRPGEPSPWRDQVGTGAKETPCSTKRSSDDQPFRHPRAQHVTCRAGLHPHQYAAARLRCEHLCTAPVRPGAALHSVKLWRRRTPECAQATRSQTRHAETRRIAQRRRLPRRTRDSGNATRRRPGTT